VPDGVNSQFVGRGMPRDHSRVAGARCRAPAPKNRACGSVPAHGSSKPRGRCGLKLLLFRFPAMAGSQPALAGGMHKAGVVIARRARSPVMGEIAGGYRPAGDMQPPLPLLRRLRWLAGGEQRVPAERALPVLPGQQVQGVPVQRGLDLLPPFGPVSGQGGVIGDAAPLTSTCGWMAVQENLTR
jgi:hypothetical protein